MRGKAEAGGVNWVVWTLCKMETHLDGTAVMTLVINSATRQEALDAIRAKTTQKLFTSMGDNLAGKYMWDTQTLATTWADLILLFRKRLMGPKIAMTGNLGQYVAAQIATIVIVIANLDELSGKRKKQALDKTRLRLRDRTVR